MFRLHHIHLLSSDPQGTARWYADMLGASVLGEQAGSSLLVVLGGALLKIDGSAEPLPAGNSGRYFGLEHFGLETNDVASITARAEERGAAILRPVGAGFEGNGVSDTKADIEGPDRLRIELQQPAFYWEPTGAVENPFREMVRLHHLHIRAADPWTTARWWADVFDGSIAGEFGDDASERIRVMIGGMLLNVSSPQPGQPIADAYPGPHYGLDHFGLETHDLDAAVERLRERDVGVVGSPAQADDGSRSVTAMGPDQVRVEIVQPPAYG